jgi:hypothetical protein
MKSIVILLAIIASPAFAQDTPQTRMTPIGAPSTVQWVTIASTGSQVEESAKNAVKVTFPSGNGAYSGSGVYLGDRYIATAWHVPRGTSGQGYAEFRDGTRVSVSVNGRDTVWDQCILSMDREHPTLAGVDLADANPRIGERIYSVGFGQGFRIFGGAVTSYGSPYDGAPADWVNHQSPAISGDSGGPIFNESGKLIGCLWGTGQGDTIGATTSRFQLFIRPLCPTIAQWRANRIARQIQSIAAVPQADCYGGQCPPQYGGQVSGAAGRPVISSPGNQPTPIASQAAPPQQPAPPPAISDDRVKQIIADAVAAASQPGPQGERGPQGLTGPQGPPGADGRNAEIDIEAIAAAVIAKIPPRRFVLIDGKTRQVIDDESYQPGEAIVLDIQNIIRSR